MFVVHFEHMLWHLARINVESYLGGGLCLIFGRGDRLRGLSRGSFLSCLASSPRRRLRSRLAPLESCLVGGCFLREHASLRHSVRRFAM